jgi:hypothetical protein
VPTFFRIHSGDEDPRELLERENQVSKPWGGSDHGPCDKCGGSGRTEFECESCRSAPDGACPVCSGEVRYVGECPTCRGSGEITDGCREGVSVFPSERGLYRYMLKRDTDLSTCQLVELEGEETGDVDFDADEGALLVRPTRIVEVREPDRGAIDEVAGELGADRG